MSGTSQEECDGYVEGGSYSYRTQRVAFRPAQYDEVSAVSVRSDGQSAAEDISSSHSTLSNFQPHHLPGADLGPGIQLLYEHPPDKSTLGSYGEVSPGQVGPHVLTSSPKRQHRAKSSSVHFCAIVLTMVLPFIGLVVWLGFMSKEHRIFTTLTGATLGGYLTQTQAKAIDFVCSAFLAPLLMASFNFVWFACARVCVANEVEATHRGSRGISLRTLTTASSQSTGSYNPYVLWSLFQGRTWRMVVLSLMALASAVATSALCNIIAYESFTKNIASPDSYTLRLLSDANIDLPQSNFMGSDAQSAYQFSDHQQGLAAQNVSSMFNHLAFVAATLDDDGSYVGVNATEASMESIDGSVSTLEDVPGYRLTVNCAPTKLLPESFRISTAGTGYTSFYIWTEISKETRSALNMSQAMQSYTSSYFYAGSVGDVFYDAAVPSNQFLTFYTTQGLGSALVPMKSELITVVHFKYDPSNTSSAMVTDYGLVDPIYQNVSTGLGSASRETYLWYPLSMYTLQCSLYRQDGVLNFIRNSDRSWLLTTSTFNERPVPHSSFLSNWDMRYTRNKTAPPLADNIFSSAVQYRDGVAAGFDFTLAANNILYASGEMARIIYNVASLNTSRDQPDYFYNVTGTVNREFYRVTYVPALLLTGLVCVVLCASMTLALVLSVRHSASWATFRTVDTVRLVVDAVGGGLAQEDGAEFARLARGGNPEVADWAAKYYIGYSKAVEEKEGGWQTAVRLCPSESSVRNRKRATTLEQRT